MTSKSSDHSTAHSYSSISDDSDASSLVSLVCSEVEELTEGLASPPIPREVVYHPENSSLFHPNYQADMTSRPRSRKIVHHFKNCSLFDLIFL